jgi:hypothetical protein
MSTRSFFVPMLLVWSVALAHGSSLYSVGASSAEFVYQDPFVPGEILVKASRERSGERFQLTTLTVLARDKAIPVPGELLIMVPDPDLGSIELGFLLTEKSVVFITIEFGTYVEGADPDYIRYRVNLETGEIEVDHASNESLLTK